MNLPKLNSILSAIMKSSFSVEPIERKTGTVKFVIYKNDNYFSEIVLKDHIIKFGEGTVAGFIAGRI